MGHKHTKDEILEGALAVVFDAGLTNLTFGRVARQLDISDRVVVYYFPTKDDLVGEVLVAVGLQLQETLAGAFRVPADDHVELVRRAWTILAHPDADPVFALFFEASGLAATGREPYRALLPLLVDGWIGWLATFLQGTPTRRRNEAAASVAMIDGLLLLRQLAGPDVARRAARTLGVVAR